MGYRMNKDPEAFKEIKNRFDTAIDKKTGKTMTQICREYWEAKRKGK